MKLCSDDSNMVGTPHMKMCSDTRSGSPHMKKCSDVDNRVGTSHMKMEVHTKEGHCT